MLPSGIVQKQEDCHYQMYGLRSVNEKRLRFEELENRRMLAVIVNTLLDEADGSILDGDVSLRDALANVESGGEISFSVQGTIKLTLGQLVVFKELSVLGPGPDLLVIDASGNGSRVFLIDDFDFSNQIDVHLSGITIANGDVAGSGGGIINNESLVLTNSALFDNHAGYEGYGGGINNLGSLSVENTTFTENSSYLSGGAIYSSEPISIKSSLFLQNHTERSGGAICVSSPYSNYSTSIVGSEFRQNRAEESGGGLYSTSPTSLASTTFDGNSGASGGGVYVDRADLDIVSSYLHANSAIATFGRGGGGGLW